MSGIVKMKGAIHVTGSSILSSRARRVQPHEFAGLEPLVSRMRRIFVETKAQGLAAPQLGESLRLFMLSQERDDQPPLLVVNPRVRRRSKSFTLDWESCLSVPDHAALVSRASKVDVEYQTLTAPEPVRAIFKG